MAGGGRRFVVQVSQPTEARIKLGQSQADFAAMLWVSVRTLQEIESRDDASLAGRGRRC